jgi:hypothetical protein
MLDEELPEDAGRLLARLGNIKENTASRLSKLPRSSPPVRGLMDIDVRDATIKVERRICIREGEVHHIPHQ